MQKNNKTSLIISDSTVTLIIKKENKMKKLVIIAMCFIMLAAAFAGCKTADSDSAVKTEEKAVKSDKADETETNDATEDSFVYTGEGPVTDEDVTLTWLGTNSNYTNADLATAEIVLKVVEMSGVKVNFELLPAGNYADAVSPRLAAGLDLPDIVQLPDKDQTLKYINADLFLPINEYYDKYSVNLKDLYAAELGFVKASLTAPDGNMYYVPQIGTYLDYQPCFMVNTVWLENLGLEEPTTMDEFTDMLIAFRDNDPNGNGEQDELPLSIMKSIAGQAFGPMFGLDLSNGFYSDDKGTVHYSYIEPAFKDCMTYLNGLYNDGLLDPDFATTTRDQISQRFAKDMTGMTFDYSWLQSQFYYVQTEGYEDLEIVVKGILPIEGTTGDRYYQGRDPITGLFGISKDCENPEVAFKFLDLAIGPVAQELYNWGIEGDTYVVEDGKNKMTGKDNDYIQKLGMNPVCLPLIQTVAIAEVLPQWHKDFNTEAAQYTKTVWPFIYSLQEEADVQNQYMSDINTYVDEMMMKFITGTESLDELDSFIETLKNMNIEKVIAVKQAQIDRYNVATGN